MAVVVKNSPASAGDMRHRFNPGSGKSPGVGNGNSLQYSCLENPTDRGAWWVIVHGVAKSQTRTERLTLSLSGFEIIFMSDFLEERF